MAENNGEQAQLSFLKRHLPYVIIGVIVIIGIGLGTFFYLQKGGNSLLGASTSDSSKENVEKIVSKVGKLIELPTSETPTVATVSDVTKLKSQQFFAHAQNGDEVLIYKDAKKAILYRPSTNKIVEVGPVNLAPEQVGTNASASAQVSVTPIQTRVIILNGTTTAGLTKKAEDQLTKKDSSISVIDRDNAGRQDYEKTIVVDVTGKNAAKAKAIATEVKGEVGSLPDDETKPDADILIILGSPYTTL